VATKIPNSLLLIATDVLTPLRSPKDNAHITGFPAISRDIRNMTFKELDAVLEELDLEVGGMRSAREQRFRQFIVLSKDLA
jgi:hypothetical protein